jgi:CRISPR-associated protein Cas2
MFVLIAYDVDAERTHIYRKLLRRHLTHIQQSVFHGNITEGQLTTLRNEIESELVKGDSVYIFHADVAASVTCTSLGEAADPDDRFT